MVRHYDDNEMSRVRHIDSLKYVYSISLSFLFHRIASAMTSAAHESLL